MARAHIRYHDYRWCEPRKQALQLCIRKLPRDSGAEQYQRGFLTRGSQHPGQFVPVRHAYPEARQAVTAGADLITDEYRE